MTGRIWPKRTAFAVAAAAFVLTPSNVLTYTTVHDALHNGFTKEQIEERMDQLSFDSEFVKAHPYAGYLIPLYYVKIWPGKKLAYIRHDLE